MKELDEILNRKYTTKEAVFFWLKSSGLLILTAFLLGLIMSPFIQSAQTSFNVGVYYALITTGYLLYNCLNYRNYPLQKKIIILTFTGILTYLFGGLVGLMVVSYYLTTEVTKENYINIKKDKRNE